MQVKRISHKSDKVIGQYLQNLIQLIFAPGRGWEDLEKAEVETFRRHHNAHPVGREKEERSNTSEDDIADAYASWINAYARSTFTRCFLPSIGVCSLSWFVKLLYDADDGTFSSISDGALLSLQHTLVSFVCMLLAALLTHSIFLATLPRLLNRSALDWGAWKGRALNMTMYCITFLGMVTLISNVVKVRVALLEFLPFYAVFIIWKGCRYLEIPPRNAGLFMLLASVCILGLTYLLSFLLDAVVANV